MSDTKRYKLRPIFWDYTQKKSVSREQIDAMGNESAYSHKDGDWVKYEDYARLKAEVERWKEASENYRLMLQDRQAHLDAERKYVERLIKAGDKMAHIHRLTGFPSYTSEWEEAKGVQS